MAAAPGNRKHWMVKRLLEDVFKTHHLSATLTPASKTGAILESKTTKPPHQPGRVNLQIHHLISDKEKKDNTKQLTNAIRTPDAVEQSLVGPSGCAGILLFNICEKSSHTWQVFCGHMLVKKRPRA